MDLNENVEYLYPPRERRWNDPPPSESHVTIPLLASDVQLNTPTWSMYRRRSLLDYNYDYHSENLHEDSYTSQLRSNLHGEGKEVTLNDLVAVLKSFVFAYINHLRGIRILPSRRRHRKSLFRIPCIAVLVIGLITMYGAWSFKNMMETNSPTGNSTRPKRHRVWAFSHNDEMQGDHALTRALNLGFGGIEVDVWLSPPNTDSRSSQDHHTIVHSETNASDSLPERDLLIGHYESGTSSTHTLQSVYLDPLMKELDERNSAEALRGGITGGLVGFYNDEPRAELILAIDMKSDGDTMWPYIVEGLQPFLNKGYLTTYDTTTSKWKRGPILVLGTGDTPLHRVLSQTTRSIFYDAPLDQMVGRIRVPIPIHIPAPIAVLDSYTPLNLTPHENAKVVELEVTKEISPMASAKLPILYHLAFFLPKIPILNPWMSIVQLYANEAHSRGIQPRWWGVLRHPWFVRKRTWKCLRRWGYSWINTDDLEQFSRWSEKQDRKRMRTEQALLSHRSYL